MNFNGASLFKPLCAGQIKGSDPSRVASAGRVGFTLNRTNTGIFVITFATPLADTSYIVQFNAYSFLGSHSVLNKTTTSNQLNTYTQGGAATNIVFVVIN